MNFNYLIPFTYIPEDNQTEITKQLIEFKDCSLFPQPSDGSEFWNCNKCPNDNDYCQPFENGDKLYFQIPIDQSVYCDSPYSPNKYNVVMGGVTYPVTSGITVQSDLGVEDRLDYVNVILNTNNSFFTKKDCFYFQIGLYNCNTGRHDYFNSEFYCRVKCNEKTILITGEYPTGTDCNGNYYGGFMTGAGIFKLSFRVRGSVESSGFEFEETVLKNNKIKSKQREVFTLFTNKIPYYVVRQLSAAFNSKQLNIDGVNYFGSVKINKNFEEGSMWIIKENLYIECDEINFSCNT